MNNPNERFRGAIKWFNGGKGFGFIVPDAQSGHPADIFVHISAVEQSKINPRDLYEGRRIEFSQEVPRKAGRKPCAVALKLLE